METSVTTPETNDMTASRQWATRPDDQRYLSLDELETAVKQRKIESWTARSQAKDIAVKPLPGREIGLSVYDPTEGYRREITPTHWSFSQLSTFAGVPAQYLRKLADQPDGNELAALNLQYCLDRIPRSEDLLILGQSNGQNLMRALTSTSYGRIWDIEVVQAVKRVNQEGRWQIPAASYATGNPKRATTLYASDRDVFIFLVDPNNPVELPAANGQKAEPLFRGFITWNSETGSQTFGLCTFLYRYICDNRIIWGMSQVQELRIRHTGGAPERFQYEGARYLRKYADESTAGIVETVEKARQALLPKPNAEKSGLENWLKARGFTPSQADASVKAAKAESNGEAPRTIWDMVQGITAYARGITHTDARIEIESKAGRIMASLQE